jgi:hypothetical protein
LFDKWTELQRVSLASREDYWTSPIPPPDLSGPWLTSRKPYQLPKSSIGLVRWTRLVRSGTGF